MSRYRDSTQLEMSTIRIKTFANLHIANITSSSNVSTNVILIGMFFLYSVDHVCSRSASLALVSHSRRTDQQANNDHINQVRCGHP